MNFLNKIIATKRQQLNASKQLVSLSQVKRDAHVCLQKKRNRKILSLSGAILRAKPFGLISEIKSISPSGGKLLHKSIKEMAGLYAKSKTDAISVLTDEIYFGGKLEDVDIVKNISKKPVIRKDFIIDPYQVYETVLSGADAFLLISSILSAKQLKFLINLGKKFNLEALVEVNNKNDLDKALLSEANLIGINNRNLKTFKIDIKNTEKLILHIPKNKIVISESGIKTSNEIKDMLSLGVKGFLIGTSIICSSDPMKKIKELKNLENYL